MKQWVLSISLLWAQAPLFADPASHCRPTSWSDLAVTVLQRAPQLSSLDLTSHVATARLKEASDPLPSNLAAEFSTGREPRGSANISASYQWTFERGGKREARMDVVRWQKQSLELDKRQLALQLLVEVGLLGERLQQIEHEQEVLKEAIGTYQAILRQFEGRPLLSPEQDANSAVFRLAKDEAALKATHMSLERTQLLGRLQFLSGCKVLSAPESKVRLERAWPGSPDTSKEVPSLPAQQIEVTQALTQAQFREAESRSSYDLTLGPLLSWDAGAKGQELQAGISLSLPLLGSKRDSLLATANAERSEKLALAEASHRQLQSERETWLEVYRQARTSLQTGISEDEARRKHERLEGIFITGRVSAPLIIESHRQLQDHLAARHQLTLKALEAFLNVRRLDGTLNKDDL